MQIPIAKLINVYKFVSILQHLKTLHFILMKVSKGLGRSIMVPGRNCLFQMTFYNTQQWKGQTGREGMSIPYIRGFVKEFWQP